MKRFCTAINCMDGRVQIPVIQYLKDHFGADYVDVISEPGPNRILADGSDTAAVESIERRVRISEEHHQSVGIAVVGHHDCAGNPSPEVEQRHHALAAARRIRSRFRHLPVIALWVNESWEVSEVQDDSANNVYEATS
ncbi:carbonic anhydrase [Thermodesulfobacteriota bacterium]